MPGHQPSRTLRAENGNIAEVLPNPTPAHRHRGEFPGHGRQQKAAPHRSPGCLSQLCACETIACEAASASRNFRPATTFLLRSGVGQPKTRGQRVSKIRSANRPAPAAMRPSSLIGMSVALRTAILDASDCEKLQSEKTRPASAGASSPAADEHAGEPPRPVRRPNKRAHATP